MRKNMIRGITLILLLVGLVAVVGCASQERITLSAEDAEVVANNKITVYKSALCGCCVGYVGELERYGFNVETINVEDTDAIKAKYGIPDDMRSCHTSVVGDYFIEGHVPIDAVLKLLKEKPDVDGIALPRMPAGSPGMPGQKSGPFKVRSLSGGITSDYINI